MGWYRQIYQSEVLSFYFSWTSQPHWHIKSVYWIDKRPQVWMFILNLHEWPYCEYEVFSKLFGKIWEWKLSFTCWYRSVTLFIFWLQLFESMMKNLNGPWRMFWKVFRWFSKTSQQKGKIMKVLEDLLRYLVYHCYISKMCYRVF